MSAFRNLVLVASAGTGKTHTLTLLLLRALLVDRIAPARVVATTFSRKAAAELRERLERSVHALRDGQPSPFVDDLLRHVPDPAQLSERARALSPALAQVHVTTMHALFLDVLTEGARALGIEQRLELIDEDEQRAEDDEIAYALVEARAAAEETAETMQELVDAGGGLVPYVTTVVDFLREVEEADRDVAGLLPAADHAAIAERVEVLVQLARNPQLRAIAAFAGPAAEVDAAAREGDVPRLADALDALRRVAARGNADVVRNEFKKYKDAWPSWGQPLLHAREFAPLALAFRDFLCDVRSERRARALRTGRIGFGDVLRMAKDLLQRDVEFARRIGARFDVLVVDEFQDTSPLQRELLALLWEDPRHARAAGQPATLDHVRPRGLAVVGDRKQAIYGFRGADVAVFGDVAVALAGDQAARALRLPESGREGTARFAALRDNYRSAPALLQFVNRLSARCLQPSDTPRASYEIEYSPEIEDLQVPKARAAREPDPARPPVYWLPFAGKDDEAQANAIARELRAWMQGSPLRYADIAILARTNATVDTCAAVLSAHGIPVVVGGTRFYRTQEIGDCRAVLELLTSARPGLAAAEVLRGPAASVLDASLLELSRAARLGQVSRWNPEVVQDVADRARIAQVRDVVLHLLPLASRTPPEQLLELAIEALSLRAVWASLPAGALRLANVEKLLEIARRFRSSEALVRFLRVAWNDDSKRESQAATFRDDDDAVRILTIHASKGLAFPIVFVPRIEWQAPAGPGQFAAALADGTLSVRLRDREDKPLAAPSWERVAETVKRRELAERRRLMYVACTRAERHLVFVGGTAPKGEGMAAKGELAQWLQALELPTRDVPEELAQLRELAPRHVQAAERQKPLVPPARLRVTPTAVQDFVLCPRRYVLAHVIAVPEERPAFARAPAPLREPDEALTMSAREEGTRLHRLLETVEPSAFGSDDPTPLLRAVARPEEAELLSLAVPLLTGGYAKRIAEEGASVERERVFTSRHAVDGGAVVVAGSIDLVVHWPVDPRGDAGSRRVIDVVDYKRSRLHSIERYRSQVAVYRAALAERHPDAEVRAGLWSMHETEPHFFDAGEVRAASEEIRSALVQLHRSAHTADTQRKPPDYCLRIRCGFRPRCHSDA